MKPSDETLAAIADLPAALCAVVAAELAAGNVVAEVLHGHPVPPAGVGIRLVRPLSVPLPSAAAGVRPWGFSAWDGSCGYSDEPKHNFVLGPAEAPADQPSMAEIRDAANRPSRAAVAAASDSLLDRFKRSLEIDYEKWREGTGYDLDAIRDASVADRASIESLLRQRGVRGWRDVEALWVLDSPRARDAMRSAIASGDHEVALAVVRYAPEVLDEETRTAIIVRGLEGVTFFGGLLQALNQAEAHHPAPVIEALLRGVLRRDGDVAASFAAMLMFLHGRAETAFDMDQRPFFLTFNTADPTARAAAFRALCGKIGVDAGRYLDLG
ncbi:MAG: hypothetical protein GY926_27365 [bacterium]|nr:hypothetical protein [bacterium]